MTLEGTERHAFSMSEKEMREELGKVADVLDIISSFASVEDNKKLPSDRLHSQISGMLMALESGKKKIELLKDALSDLSMKVHSGYNFNADPERITKKVGDALNAASGCAAPSEPKRMWRCKCGWDARAIMESGNYRTVQGYPQCKTCGSDVDIY